MNCFQHSQKAAIGHCSYCGRGLCHDCATVVDGKLSCRGNCEEEIARERRLVAHSEAALSDRSMVFETSSGVYQRSFAFSAITGIATLVFGFVLLGGQKTIPGAILIGIGAMLLIHGLGLARASKRYKALAADRSAETVRS